MIKFILIFSVLAFTVLIESLWENVFFSIYDESIVENFDVGVILLDEVGLVGVFRAFLFEALLLNGAKIGVFNVKVDKSCVILQDAILQLHPLSFCDEAQFEHVSDHEKETGMRQL